MRHADWSDKELVRRLQQHDPEALEMLISRYERPLSNAIREVLSGVGGAQDVEECVTELFSAVWQEIEKFDAARLGTFQRWLTMRAKYIALSRRRKQLSRKRTQGENGEILGP